MSPTFRAPAIRNALGAEPPRRRRTKHARRDAAPEVVDAAECANERRPMPFDKLAAVMTPEAVEAARTSGALRETDDTGFYPSAAM